MSIRETEVSDELPHARPIGHLRRWLRRVTGTVSLLLAVAGLVLHGTVRDHWIATSLVFYALPPIIIALFAGLALLAYWRDLSSRIVRTVAVAGFLLVAGWSQSCSWRTGPDVSIAEEDIRVVFWNTRHLAAGSERIARAVGQFDADIIALCEAGPATEEQRALWRNACPGYDVTFLGNEMMVLTRGTSGDSATFNLSNHTEVRQLEVVLPEGCVTCLLVDVASSPMFPRRQALKELAAIADAASDRPLLILGDFNTPSDSVLFGPLRDGHDNAFEEAGRGFRPTWPVPLPVLDLDQIWTNRKVEIRECGIGWWWVSDHRPVHVLVRLEDDSGLSGM
ncbi:endonuclease/exonuclease/phosphatase family protein [Maioricimonas sp. JC845]|uniref:endonuclease/exonuclease/phosphatase family protein n=1 Tax=Maioricimonas sp. JC845 TaxID=3232138 RepID=UPI0034586DFF